jgi:hypothetical protein
LFINIMERVDDSTSKDNSFNQITYK